MNNPAQIPILIQNVTSGASSKTPKEWHYLCKKAYIAAAVYPELRYRHKVFVLFAKLMTNGDSDGWGTWKGDFLA